ncbi:hypothetical protein [Brenneria tiliae]|uniref:Uncharacterized protein n=1 Tax=Brenneria tiliae TaxID=2914984 RepID=A0ABT0MUV0_9GAMM|nr:hypothetical protein [Brenneria tiliae]MCL2893621.1 hypothetical protein [Brenneria tiliae]
MPQPESGEHPDTLAATACQDDGGREDCFKNEQFIYIGAAEERVLCRYGEKNIFKP